MIDLLNAVLGAFADAANAALHLLPTSPLAVGAAPSSGGLMGYAAYFLPLHEFGVLLDAVLAATIIWYGVRVLLHWAKVAAS